MFKLKKVVHKFLIPLTLERQMAKKVAIVALLALFSLLLPSGTAQTVQAQGVSEQCRRIANDLVNYVDTQQGQVLAFQLSFNKSRWDQIGHFSLAEGYLSEFDPRGQSRIAHLFPNNGRAIFQPASVYVMKVFKDTKRNKRGRSYPTERRDQIYLHMTEMGDVTIILRSWGNARLSLENAHCTSDSFGYYMNGLMREGNGTSAISLVMRKVDR